MNLNAKFFVYAAALLGLFLGALDALIVGAAMPTIMSELGGLHLYSWVFSAYLLTRAVSLPVFGKLCDLFSTRKLYLAAIFIFVTGSLFSGAAQNMAQLIAFRAVQGIGAGGTFALAYIVVSDLSPSDKRGKMLGWISSVWGIASILGPAMGGFMVAFLSWRWIFYVNVPLGCLAIAGIYFFLEVIRRRDGPVSVDYQGAMTLTTSVLVLLLAFLLAGREYPWLSPQILGLLGLGILSGIAFYRVEKSAREPILSMEFFRRKQFSLSNGAAFFSSFAIFSLSSFGPLFIQGSLRKTPAELGIAMVPLSLAWSAGAFLCGQLIDSERAKLYSVSGSCLLVVSSLATLGFSSSTPLALCSAVFALAGFGMGLVSVSTLIIVQNSLPPSNLGIATSSQQFARTLGGTIGIGVSGSLVTSLLVGKLEQFPAASSAGGGRGFISSQIIKNMENLFQPEILAQLPPHVQELFQAAVGKGVRQVFGAVLAASLTSLFLCTLLPGIRREEHSGNES